MKRFLLVLLLGSLLSGCQKRIEETVSETMSQAVETTEYISRDEFASMPAVFTETRPPETSVEDTYTQKRLTTDWFATIIVSSEDSWELKEVELDNLFTDNQINIYHDLNRELLLSYFKEQSDIEVYDKPDRDNKRIYDGKTDSIIRFDISGWQIYAFTFGYTDQSTILTFKDDAPVNQETIRVSYNSKNLCTDVGNIRIYEPPILEEEDIQEERVLVEGVTDGVAFDSELNEITVESVSGKVYTYNLNLDNYEVAFDEESGIWLTNMDSGGVFSVRVFGDAFDYSYTSIKRFNTGYDLYMVEDGYVIASEDASWLWLSGEITQEDAEYLAEELVG